MYLDTTTVFAGSLGTALAFGLFRLFVMWKRWSNSSKENEEIDWDKKIADAIKLGDVEAIARLRKYFLSYKRSRSAQDAEEPSQTQYSPNTLYLCKEGRFWFLYREDGSIELFKAFKCLFASGESASVLKVSEVTDTGDLRKKSIKKFKTSDDLFLWLKSNYAIDPKLLKSH